MGAPAVAQANALMPPPFKTEIGNSFETSNKERLRDTLRAGDDGFESPHDGAFHFVYNSEVRSASLALANLEELREYHSRAESSGSSSPLLESVRHLVRYISSKAKSLDSSSQE